MRTRRNEFDDVIITEQNAHIYIYMNNRLGYNWIHFENVPALTLYLFFLNECCT